MLALPAIMSIVFYERQSARMSKIINDRLNPAGLAQDAVPIRQQRASKG